MPASSPASKLVPPPVKAEAHWKKFELPLGIGSGRSAIAGQAGIRMAFFQNTKDQSLVGRVWFSEGTAGPPLHVHGGMSAYVLDEAMGSACWLAGYGVVAANFDVDFLNMTPVGIDLVIEARMERVRGQNVFVEAEIKDEAGTAYTIARGRFHRLPKAKLEKLFASQGLDINAYSLKFLEDKKI